MTVLGIETSCDETSAAVLRDGKILSNVISSHLIHRDFGGVVPELASRAHQQLIIPVIAEALNSARTDKHDVEAVAVTSGPGLMGALLVGVNFAKAFAYSLGIPFIGVNHMEAHIYANFLEDPRPSFPFLCLIVSGGHTQLVMVEEEFRHTILGETLDDAAGEAYDKVAKMLGLGFPGGPAIDRLARSGNPGYVKFPRSFLDRESFDFSFSGIKTAVMYWLRDHPANGGTRPESEIRDLAASFQSAVVDVLVEKTLAAAGRHRLAAIAIAGGVSANSELRRRMKAEAGRRGLRVFIPRTEYCTDNAAMVALAGSIQLAAGKTSSLELRAVPSLSF